MILRANKFSVINQIILPNFIAGTTKIGMNDIFRILICICSLLITSFLYTKVYIYTWKSILLYLKAFYFNLDKSQCVRKLKLGCYIFNN